ncbi:MAG: hypothetical protein HFE81_00965 [Bacilli bacterium]|nr:hypothetical protein [Bacilli bacterium]
MKLTPAKCPSCGANIDVNEKLEKTICQYCGTTVLVDDAVQKYKIEISGNVKVSGVKDADDYIKEATKHLKLNEYKDALESARKAIKLDNFNVEALALELRTYIAIVGQCHRDDMSFLETAIYTSSDWGSVRDIQTMYDRIVKIAEEDNKNVEKILTKKVVTQIHEMFDAYEDSLKDYNVCREIINIIDEYRKTFKYKVERDTIEDYLSDTFGTIGSFRQCRLVNIPTGGKVKLDSLEEMRDYLNSNYEELRTYIKEKTKTKVAKTKTVNAVKKTSNGIAFVVKKALLSLIPLVMFVGIIVVSIGHFKDGGTATPVELAIVGVILLAILFWIVKIWRND